ncbi:MAG TPA: glycoside hydrolase family 88 protein [Acidobacteriaceae bacterium]|jgi:rhamnogalacturonyl hydrolase YesR|nr:glycoside hydrolase family 88 protein [Acidobacteriaceae bacterium]
MSVRRNLEALAIAAAVFTFGATHYAIAQEPAPAAPPALTDTPTAPPNTEQMRLKGIDRDNMRMFGSSPDDPGPLATDLSSAIAQKAIDAAARKVGDWELATFGPYFAKIDPAPNHLWDGRIWTWSVLYTGFDAAAVTLPEKKYWDAMEDVGNAYHWGLRNEKHPNGDDMSIAQMYIEHYLKEHKPEQIAVIKQALDNILADPRVAANTPGKRIEWWWCDALYMAPATWVRMYAATGDRKYVQYVDEEWLKTSDLLYDKEAHLYWRDASYIGKTEKNGQKLFWSRGNGWVMGGLARTLEYLPRDDPKRSFYQNQLREMSAALARIQGADGLWRSGLLDPAAYPEPEISGSALITFGMAWGINNGILDRKTYTPVVTKAWQGMLRHVYADGRLGDIQQTGAAPSTFKPSATYNYGVGGYLLAASEMHKLASAKK